MNYNNTVRGKAYTIVDYKGRRTTGSNFINAKFNDSVGTNIRHQYTSKPGHTVTMYSTCFVNYTS